MENILSIAIKSWLNIPENRKKWRIKKKELKYQVDIIKKLKNHPKLYIPLRLAYSAYLTQLT